MTFKILNLTVDRDPFREFDRIKRQYYRQQNINFSFIYNDEENYNFVPELEDIMYRIGIPNEYNYILNTSTLPAPAGIPMMLNKFLFEIQKPEYQKYDYVIRTNSSTFINVDLLKEFLLSKVIKGKMYAGLHFPTGTFPGISSFISGTMIIIPKSIIKILRSISVPHNISCLCDDVALGIIIERLCNGKPYHIPIFSCSYSNLIASNLSQVTQTNLMLRIKSEHLQRNNETDLAIWRAIEASILYP